MYQIFKGVDLRQHKLPQNICTNYPQIIRFKTTNRSGKHLKMHEQHYLKQGLVIWVKFQE